MSSAADAFDAAFDKALDAALDQAASTLAAIDASGAMDFLKSPTADAADQWGPFRPNLNAAERLARIRALRALVQVYGRHGWAAADAALRRFEGDARRIGEAVAALRNLPGDGMRQLREAFEALHATP